MTAMAIPKPYTNKSPHSDSEDCTWYSHSKTTHSELHFEGIVFEILKGSLIKVVESVNLVISL